MGRAKSQTERNEAAKRKRKIISAVQWVLAIIVVLIIVFPIYWMLVSSVKSQEEILLAVPTLWPKEFHFENYINVLKRGNFAKYYYNTIVMTAGILICQVTTGVFAAYGFSKGKFKGQNILFLIVLGALMIPIQVTFIPIYIVMANRGFSDTFLGLILPVAVSPYFIFMLRQNFMAIDDSYVEAARIDGLGRVESLQRYWRQCVNLHYLPLFWLPLPMAGTPTSGQRLSQEESQEEFLPLDLPSCRIPLQARKP